MKLLWNRPGFALAALALTLAVSPSGNASLVASGWQEASDVSTTCLAHLQKLDKAVNLKMSLRDYSTRVAETRGLLEKCLPRVSTADLKKEIISAMEAFMDAGSAWEEMVRFDFMAAEYEPGSTLQRKYSIETSESATGRIMGRSVVLTAIWKEARRHIEKASRL